MNCVPLAIAAILTGGETVDGPQAGFIARRDQWEGRQFATDDGKPAAVQEPKKIRVLSPLPGARPFVRANRLLAIEFVENEPVVVEVRDTSGTRLTLPITIDEFIELRIGRMKDVCELSAEQVKKLKLAGKGAAYRIKSKHKRTLLVDGKEFTLNVPPDHDSDLAGQSIWEKTIEKTLNEAQLKKWLAREEARKETRNRGRMWRLNQGINARNTDIRR